MTAPKDIPLAAKPVNRAAHHRLDQAWLEAAFKKDDVLVLLMQSGAPLLQNAGGLLWLGSQASALPKISQQLFLGLDKAGAAIFAIEMDETFNLETSPIAGLGEFTDPRAAFGRLNAMEANLASTARSLFEWHRTHGYCAKCGAATAIVEAGWKRACPSCKAEHFPRTDPVAIMLAVKDDKCLLGRQAIWPPGFYSCLAGFVEPGETVEQAAARELEEEAGIKADWETAEYLFAQPWPFPSSLMVGLILQANTVEIRVDEVELEEARWFTREEARQILNGQHETVYAPPEMAVAHHILKVWAFRDASH